MTQRIPIGGGITLTPPAYAAYLRDMAARMGAKHQFQYDNPADFIEAEMVIPETRRPLVLHPEQRAVLSAFNARQPNGDFMYSLWLYSAPKKSAKTTIMAGVALWQAWRIPDGEIYIVGNDQKQADNRMAQAIRFAIMHNPRLVNRARVTKSSYRIDLDNGTRIEAIPVDPRGEAGMNPTGIFWTEAWGAMGNRAELLWSEATLSPTRAGQSLKVVESYAGYTGESLILERLYISVVKEGAAHPDVPEVYSKGAAIVYWCTRRYLDWQTNAAAQAYYAQEEIEKTPAEYRRVHGNEWVSSEDIFVPSEWWDACKSDLPPMGQFEGVVIGLDAAVSNDSFGVVAVSKIEFRRQVDNGDGTFQERTFAAAVRYAREWKPPKGGKIDFAEVELELRRLATVFHVVQFAYDPYQLHDLATRLRKEGVGWFKEFSQAAPRLVADKNLYDMIRDRRLLHDGNPALREHVTNANRKLEGETEKLRIVKRAEHLKIDLCVALSMALSEAMRLNL